MKIISFIEIFSIFTTAQMCHIAIGNKSNTELFDEIKKLNLPLNDLKHKKPLDTYKGLSLFYTDNDRHQIMKFSFSYPEAIKNFKFRKKFFLSPDNIFRLHYEVYCFENKDIGYLVFVYKKNSTDFIDCLSNKAPRGETSALYLINLTKLFIYYELTDIAIVPFKRSNLQCSETDFSIPIIKNFNVFFEYDDEIYQHYYQISLNEMGAAEKSHNIMNLVKNFAKNKLSRNGSTPKNKIPSMILNAYSFLTILESIVAWKITLTFDQSIIENSKDPLAKLYVECGHYIENFEQGNRKGLTSFEVKRILNFLEESQFLQNSKPPSPRVTAQSSKKESKSSNKSKTTRKFKNITNFFLRSKKKN